jgi:Pvc16 N-terminal domain
LTNHQSVATVTAILSQVVQGFAASAIDGAVVTMQRPDAVPTSGADSTKSRVNLFLFQVNFDATFRNSDLPTRDRSAQLVQRPRAALQLHYLLSFYGAETALVPQRMLAAVVAGLHAQPWISMQRAAAFVSENQDPSDTFHYLADSLLAEQKESVRLTPDSLNLEELSKLWSVFFQVPYALSIAYKASVVLVDASSELPRSVLPVRIPVVDVGAKHRAPDPTVSPVERQRVVSAQFHSLTGSIRVQSDQPILASSRVEVLLDGRGGARGFVLSVPPRSTDDALMSVPRGEVPPGTYLVRLRVNGVESVLLTDRAPSDWVYSGPEVILP